MKTSRSEVNARRPSPLQRPRFALRLPAFCYRGPGSGPTGLPPAQIAEIFGRTDTGRAHIFVFAIGGREPIAAATAAFRRGERSCATRARSDFLRHRDARGEPEIFLRRGRSSTSFRILCSFVPMARTRRGSSPHDLQRPPSLHACSSRTAALDDRARRGRREKVM